MEMLSKKSELPCKSNPNIKSDSFPDVEKPLLNNKEEVLHCQEIKFQALSNTEEPNNFNEGGTKEKWKRYLGLLLTILSSMMFSINALIFKILKSYHPLSNATYMFLVTGLLAIPFYIYQTFTRRKQDIGKIDSNVSIKICNFKDVPPKNICILLTRSFTGCSGMLFFFYSLQYLTIGDALVIACSSTVFVFLLAFLFLKESCGIIPVLTIILALIGVGIITRPPLLTGKESFQAEDLIGAALAFASMLSIASTLILMRYLQDVHHSLINLVYGTWGFIQTLLLALALGVLKSPENSFDGTLLITMGLLFFIGQTLLALALQLEEAGPVSLLRTSEVVFAFLWQFLFLGVSPDLFSVTGAVLIMIGIVTTILRKWVGSLPQTNTTRKTFSFILK